MAFENVKISYSLQAKENWVGGQYYAFALSDGLRANNGAEASGIALGSVNSGSMMEVGLFGILKYKAGGGTHNAGTKLTVTTSGWCKAAASGDYIVGQTLATTTSGSVGTGIFDFVKPTYAYSSSFVL